MSKRKICVVTGTRAEYGLLYWVMKRLADDADVEFQLVVTGMHLSHEFGMTVHQIEADGFSIARRLPILLSSDSAAAVTKSIGLANIAFADAFAELQPDLVVLLGDRFEVFAAATAALVARIPVAHCHGGELTQGAMDDALRHAITKMAHLHFTATAEYAQRVIQLGEDPSRVFTVGALGIENMNRLTLLDKGAFEESISFKLRKKNLLVTFHPVTLENATAEGQVTELLEALDALTDTGLLFTMPNADTDGRVIRDRIATFTKAHPENARAFDSLGQLRYLSALQYVDAVVGNSSSGIIEAPSFKIGTINIGDRQLGRTKAASVIDCKPEREAIIDAFDILYSTDFKKTLSVVKNPYDQGNASAIICSILKETDLQDLLKKSFYDIKANT